MFVRGDELVAWLRQLEPVLPRRAIERLTIRSHAIFAACETSRDNLPQKGG